MSQNMNDIHQEPTRPASKPRPLRAAFTLVEMLVSVALVLLMMILFAEIFQLAAGAMSRAKGLAENDQRVRTLTTLLRSDVEARTFETLIPYAAGEPEATSGDLNWLDRQGYFYISENQLTSQTDDVLALTISTAAKVRDYPFKPDIDYPFFGKVALIDTANGLDNTDEPEFDDGQVEVIAGSPPTQRALDNNTGASRFAEVVYFVRNGNLYRRMLLIREPYLGSAAHPPHLSGDWSPANGRANSFWNDFDYSARYFTGSPPGVKFVSSEDRVVSTGGTQFPLGRPYNRFGFDSVTGNPREYALRWNPNTSANDQIFIGRFTHEETSSPAFGYPGYLPDFDGDGTPDNPMNRSFPLGTNGANVSYGQGADGLWGTQDDLYFRGPRVAEDLLLSNVHAFDVKVWDEALGQFMDVGHATAGGDFYQSATDTANNRNLHLAASPAIAYGPHGTAANNRIFDTWHPHLDFDDADSNGSHDNGRDPPPFRPAASAGADGILGTNDDVDPKRLRAIQITVLFMDTPSEQMRQLTLQIPLVN